VRFAGGVTAVNGLAFSVAKGETLAIVGESGCGKTVTALSLLGLLPPKAATMTGSIVLEGQELVGLSQRELRHIRGRRIAMVFQDPMSALNPVQTIGVQIVEALRAHQRFSRTEAWRRAEDLLALVRIPEPGSRLRDYPHRLSGGMRQRVVIALALASNPAVLVADEPTTALDVTIQAQILRLLSDIQRELSMAIVLITHDLGVVAETAHRVMVMYAGRKVETQSVYSIFDQPRHPYTRGLMAATPRAEHTLNVRRLEEIPGIVPSLAALPDGCAFAPRCPFAETDCAMTVPSLREVGQAVVACHHPLQPVEGTPAV
jgi:peptide/nickel transport system ATP-binding protein